jgi:hypothetical protein
MTASRKSRGRRTFGLTDFERHHEPVLPLGAFVWRMLRTLLVAIGFLVLSLALGTFGYHWIAGLDWLDATLNAAMILTGMGPVDRMETASAKWFATVYALFSGVAFLTIAGLFVAPIAHRVLHHFHVAADEDTLGKK